MFLVIGYTQTHHCMSKKYTRRKFLKNLSLVTSGGVVLSSLPLTASAYANEREDGPIIYLEWTDDPLTTMIVHMISEESGTGPDLEFREVGSNLWESVSGASDPVPGSSRRRSWYVLSDLTPGTSYEFRIGITTENCLFRTPPSDLDERDFNFVVGGDVYRNQYFDRFVQVAREAAATDPYFVALSGDLVYGNADERNIDRWFGFLGAWHDFVRTPDGYFIPLLVTVADGELPMDFNNDVDDAILVNALFRFPKQQGYGAFHFGDYLSLIMLNTNHVRPIEGEQTQWLEETLMDSQHRDHVFPVAHWGAYPGFRQTDNSVSSAIREHWVPLYEEYEIRFAFEHNDHVYKRTFPIKNGEIDETGIRYFGDGGWGFAQDRTPKNYWYLENSEGQISHFFLVQISNEFRRAIAIDENGTQFDSYEEYIFLPAPTILSASEISRSGFVANWEELTGAIRYRLDVSTDVNFTTFVEGYENLEVEDGTSYAVEGLESHQNYYYRVRAESPVFTSDPSSIVEVKTVVVDPFASTVDVRNDRVFANGEQANRIRVTVIDEDGVRTSEVPVILEAVNGESEITDVQARTNEDGYAYFEVTNTVVEDVTYRARVGDVEISDTVQVRFVEVEEVVSLGNNYPNPFRDQTTIPFAIPAQMRVRIVVANVLGASVRNLLDSNLSAGFYEIPFDGRDLASGTYFYRIITEERVDTRKMALVK